MKIDLAGGELCLDENRPLRMAGASGLYVHCLSGTVWITTTNEPGDIFLGAGQSHRIGSGLLTLIESVGQARIRLEYPAADRLMKGWPGLLTRGFCATRRAAGDLLATNAP
ncbi:MAG TPA: DUF2917 domain-containing protein [Azonexus sp.]|nr:DUF2917 domain-containing protein [Azonexus sp.]